MKWEKVRRIVGPEGTTITYATKGTSYKIESRKRHIPHAGGREGTWDHTTYVVQKDGIDKMTFTTLKDAQEFVDKLIKEEA